MIELYENGIKVAEMPESEWWNLDAKGKASFVRILELTNRTLSVNIDSVDSRSTYPISRIMTEVI